MAKAENNKSYLQKACTTAQIRAERSPWAAAAGAKFKGCAMSSFHLYFLKFSGN
jgi:hypothetical protein